MRVEFISEVNDPKIDPNLQKNVFFVFPSVNMAARRKRDDIGLATCKRLILQGSSKADRITEDAVIESRKAVKSFLKEVGRSSSRILRMKGSKTVSQDVLEAVFLDSMRCYGVKSSDLSSAPRSGQGQRGLPLEGVVRVVKKSLEAGDRISDEAKKALVGAAEAYLKALGANSNLMVQAGRRQTIQAADILAARQTFH